MNTDDDLPPDLGDLPPIAVDIPRKRLYVSFGERRIWAVYAALKRIWWGSVPRGRHDIILRHVPFPVQVITNWKKPLQICEEFTRMGWTLECAEGIVEP